MPPTKDTSKDLVPFTETFAIAANADALATVMRENLGKGGVSPFDLDRVKIPTGGGRTWSLPTLEGEADVREIEGVIVAWSEPRAYWETAFGGGGVPPDCSSADGETGQGMYGIGSDLHPHGDCDTCPMSQWGSKLNEKGEETRGQACRQMRLLLVLQPEALLPLAMFLPPTSIKPVHTYFMRLAAQGLPYYGVMTGLSLVHAQSGDGITYSQVVPRMAGKLSLPDRETVHAYGASLQSALDAVVLTREDVEA